MSREEFNSKYQSMVEENFSDFCILDYTGKVPREEIMYKNDYTMSSIMNDYTVDSYMYNSISKRLCRVITTDIDIRHCIGDITEENILEAKSRLESRLGGWRVPVGKVGKVCMLMSWDIYYEFTEKGLLSEDGTEYKGIKIIVDHSRTCNNYKRVILYLSGSIIVSVSRPSELDFKSRDVQRYNNGEYVDLVKENGSVTWEVGVKQVARDLLVLK
jgi:hypothetical protein